MDLNLEVSPVYVKNIESQKRIRLNQGGTRSGKTWSILQVLITLAFRERDAVFTILRKSGATLRGTAMRDFFEILHSYNLYNIKDHNRSDNIYHLNGNTFEFLGLDDPKKKRGAKRKHLFINEVNELTYEDWKQLIMRTSGLISADYNPSDEFHWLYDRIVPREDCDLIHSTYLDNYSFLEPSLVKEIERLKDEDVEAWTVYGLGERAASGERIYTNWDYDYSDVADRVYYGLDFGYNNPTALVRIGENDDELHIKQEIYERKLTNSNLIERMNELNISKSIPIYADSAEPNRIEEIASAGYNIYPADKSVKDGIDYVKRKKKHIHRESHDLIKELKFYKWKTDRNGNIEDEPVKFNDHGCDALRYGCYTDYKMNIVSIGMETIG